MGVSNGTNAGVVTLNVSNGANVNSPNATVTQNSGMISILDTSSATLGAITQSTGNINIGGSATLTAASIEGTGNGVFALNISGSAVVNAGSEFSGVLDQTSGTLNAQNIGYQGTFTGGTMNVNGGVLSAASENVTGISGATPVFGDAGSNVVANLTNGAEFKGGTIAYAGGVATLNESGTPTNGDLLGPYYVGVGGSGSGATFVPSVAQLNISNSGTGIARDISLLQIGLMGGVGTMTVQNAKVSIGDIYLGMNNTSGHRGTGTLTVSDGSTVTAGNIVGLEIGNAGGMGTLNLGVAGQTDVGTTFTETNTLFVGGSVIPGTFGNGTLNVYAGATLNAQQGLTAVNGATTTGTINLAGGKISTTSLTLGLPSDFNWTAGELDITNSAFTIGSGGPLNTVNLSGGKILHTQFGTTTIASGGSLNITGGTFLSGPVAISSGGTLSGGGPISGATTVAAGGTISPGDPAIQTYSASLDLSGGGTYDWQLASPPKDNSTGTAGTDFDQVQVTGGNLKLGGTSNFNVNTSLLSAGDQPDGANHNAFWNSSHVWTVAQVSGSATNTGGTNFATVANGALFPRRLRNAARRRREERGPGL